jgi:hypothetical protein
MSGHKSEGRVRCKVIQWHDLKVRIAGTKVEGYLDGNLYLEHVLLEPVAGRIGLWSKADSHMYFDNYTVTPGD